MPKMKGADARRAEFLLRSLASIDEWIETLQQQKQYPKALLTIELTNAKEDRIQGFGDPDTHIERETMIEMLKHGRNATVRELAKLGVAADKIQEAEEDAGPRKPNGPFEQIFRVRVLSGALAILDRMIATGFFGSTRAEACHAIVRNKTIEMWEHEAGIKKAAEGRRYVP